MILSYHPCYEAETNLLCAGRDPDADDLKAIQRAAAVILPQGCRPSLYRMARENCRYIFPNYDARFAYPGKTGQVRLFKTVDVPHPQTWIFHDLVQFRQWQKTKATIRFPMVFKLDWGGEGETVMLLESTLDLEKSLARAAEYEKSGQRGFILQAMIPHAQRTLRVVVIGQTLKAYWRIQDDPGIFGTSLNGGARIDHDVRPVIRRKIVSITRRFCQQTRINLAGLDFLFHESDLTHDDPSPFMLEINYFFGRAGLGGSTPFYVLLQAEIDNWLAGLGLATDRPPSGSVITEG
jgi:ribosomal protein S6--L-glutamate ligase